MSGTVVAVCRVHQLLPDRGSIGVTGIDKRAVETPLRVTAYGLYGDVQADRKHHGGLDQAVYAYAEEDVARFADLLPEVAPGLFGENLRTRGIDVSGAVVGERWQIGERLILEVTSPRTPCGTFERRLGIRGWQARFTAEAAPGAYLRVVRAGDVAAGDPIDVTSRPEHGVTIGRWFAERGSDDARALLDADAAGRITLADDDRRYAERALR